MSQDEIHEAAQRSTPPEVVVPNTIAALVTWSIGKFGIGAVIVILLGIGVRQLYYDGKEKDAVNLATTAKVIAAFEIQTRSSAEQTYALREVTKGLENTQREVRELSEEMRRPRHN